MLTRSHGIATALASLLVLSPQAKEKDARPGEQRLALTSLDGLEPRNVTLEAVEHAGHRCVRVREDDKLRGEPLVLLPGIDFQDGTIELDLAGVPRPDARPDMRGFVGLAFRLQDGPAPRYECFYLRPTNGRAEDQLRRNHSTQYVAHPDWPWDRLRKESPGVYESYVDLVPDAWTHVRITVKGTSARFYVNGAEQPTLLVNDLKNGTSRGALALWIGAGTQAHFRDLRVVPE